MGMGGGSARKRGRRRGKNGAPHEAQAQEGVGMIGRVYLTRTFPLHATRDTSMAVSREPAGIMIGTTIHSTLGSMTMVLCPLLRRKMLFPGEVVVDEVILLSIYCTNPPEINPAVYELALRYCGVFQSV